jgi:nucleolar GTP-binding protein
MLHAGAQAPNVGKSSIVRAISSGTPEVNCYPFTTRGVTIGHVEVFWSENNSATVVPVGQRSLSLEGAQHASSKLCQIMDSPGLLVRPDDERNEMEALTLAAMQHLPTAVMFVMDLSGAAGDKCSSIEDQLILRTSIRKRFPRRPWIDVLSKFDLGVDEDVLEKLEIEVLEGAPYIELSIHENMGTEDLKRAVVRILGEIQIILEAMSAVDSDGR